MPAGPREQTFQGPGAGHALGQRLQMDDSIRELERQLGRKTLEVEILKEASDKSRSKN